MSVVSAERIEQQAHQVVLFGKRATIVYFVTTLRESIFMYIASYLMIKMVKGVKKRQ